MTSLRDPLRRPDGDGYVVGHTPAHTLDADHDGKPDFAATPSQVRWPWRATLRTALPLVVAAGVVLPVAWQIVSDEMTPWLPADVLAAIGWVLGFLAALATAGTRIMAIPQVDAWLTATLNWGAAPRTPDTTVPGKEGQEAG